MATKNCLRFFFFIFSTSFQSLKIYADLPDFGNLDLNLVKGKEKWEWLWGRRK